MGKLADALRRRYKTPQAAVEALGLDAALLSNDDAALGGKEEDEMRIQLSPKAALAAGTILGWYNANKPKSNGMAMDAAADLINPIFAGVTSKNYDTQIPALAAAVSAALKGKLANDVSIEDVTTLIGALQGTEAGADTTTEANAGVPPYMREDPEDADDESEEERREDEGCDRRARDARDRLGHDESEEEQEEREEEEAKDAESESFLEDPPSGREPHLIGGDRKSARDKKHADDFRKRMGRDESEEEHKEWEEREEAKDRMRAHDRRRLGRDYRKARDAHRSARDAHRRAAADWRRAHDGHRDAMDARNADDAARHARDMQKADDEARRAHDAMTKARDARHRARDARRAHDKRFGRDEPPPFKGRPNTGGTMDKAAMDEAIDRRVAEAVRENDRRHREISEALRVVRPKAGELAMDGTITSAAGVYDRALTVLGVEHAGIREVAALRRMFEMAPRPGGDPRDRGFALDAAPGNGKFAALDKLFSNVARVEQI
jgi:hypothetical protein